MVIKYLQFDIFNLHMIEYLNNRPKKYIKVYMSVGLTLNSDKAEIKIFNLYLNKIYSIQCKKQGAK